MSIKFAFSRPTANESERDELFGHFTAAGYDGLQLKHGQYAGFLDDPEQFVERWGHLQGIGSVLITGGSLDENNVQALRRLYKFASKIGTEIVVFCHGVSRNNVTDQDIVRYAKLLSELGEEARQVGLKLSLHHHFDQPVMYRKDFDLFFENVKDNAVGLTVDTAHLVKSGINDVAEVITSFKGVIDNFHMKDFAEGNWRILGQGDIDFKPIFKAIREIDYRDWMSADEESGGGIRDGMTDCLGFMKDQLR